MTKDEQIARLLSLVKEMDRALRAHIHQMEIMRGIVQAALLQLEGEHD